MILKIMGWELYSQVTIAEIRRPKSIKCTKGVAEITIKLVYVEVPVGGYLRIHSQNQSKTYQNGTFTNETIVFNTAEVNIDYFLGTDGQTSTGY
jgi:hypothetical protein